MSEYKIVVKVWVLRSSAKVYRNLFATELHGLHGKLYTLSQFLLTHRIRFVLNQS
jgi:hypothetical protein